MNQNPQIGPYTLQRLLGGGGMADVYLAWDNANRWPVALKLLRAATGQDARMLQRFEREAALLMKLRHPHIIQVYDAGQTDDGRPYIAMEYVTGGDLVDLIQQRKGNKPVSYTHLDVYKRQMVNTTFAISARPAACSNGYQVTRNGNR